MGQTQKIQEHLEHTDPWCAGWDWSVSSTTTTQLHLQDSFIQTKLTERRQTTLHPQQLHHPSKTWGANHHKVPQTKCQSNLGFTKGMHSIIFGRILINKQLLVATDLHSMGNYESQQYPSLLGYQHSPKYPRLCPTEEKLIQVWNHMFDDLSVVW